MRAFVFGVLASITVASSPAAAGDSAKAQALYNDAKANVAAGNWSEACPKLAESQSLDPKMNTVYRLAECYEHVGKRASAWRRYREAAIAATTAGETGKAKAALERAEKLEPTLPHLAIQNSEKGGTVRVDSVAVTEASVAVDPGAHIVEVTAPNKKPYRSTVVIPDDASTTTLAIPALEDASVATAKADEKPPVTDVAPEPPRSSSTKVIGIVLAGTGVVAIGVGGFLALSARSKYHDADPHCPPAGCDAIGAAATDDARTLGNIATVVMGAGLAIGITGTVLWLTAPSTRDTPRVGVTVLPSGLLLRGEF